MSAGEKLNNLDEIIESPSFLTAYRINLDVAILEDRNVFKLKMGNVNDSEVLMDLRQLLVSQVQHMFNLVNFEAYNDNLTMNKVIDDVYTLSISIIDRKPSVDFNGIFKELRTSVNPFEFANEMEFEESPGRSTYDEWNMCMADVKFLIQRMSDFENAVTILKSEKATLTIKVCSLEQSNERLQRQVNAISVKPRTPAPKTPASGQIRTATNESSRVAFEFPPIQELAHAHKKRRVEQVGDQSKPSYSSMVNLGVPTSKPSVSVRKVLPASGNTIDSKVDKKRKPQKKTIGTGDDNDDEFKVVASKRYFPVYMGHVENTMTVDQVMRYLNSKNIGVFDLEKLNTDKHGKWSSFNFKIPYENKEKINDPQMWKKGLSLRYFIRGKNTSPNTGTSGVVLTEDSTPSISNNV